MRAITITAVRIIAVIVTPTNSPTKFCVTGRPTATQTVDSTTTSPTTSSTTKPIDSRTTLPTVNPERMLASQPRALGEVERKEVLRVLHEPEHVDEAQATVYAKLSDDGVYLASTSTMYRILHGEGEVSERRRQATHPPRVKPELVACDPNVV